MADTKISALCAVASVAGTNEFAVNEAGTSKKATTAQINTFLASSSQTLTNKIIDADGAGNSITNIENADIKAAAAIAFSKLAALCSANLLVGSACNVATIRAVTGDVTISNTGVTTIANNAVTLGKMATGTIGNLITYGAAGAPSAVATGTAGQVLTSNGACVAPTFQAAGAAGGFTFKVKASDQSINCDAVLSNDACLTFCVTANSKYAMIMSAWVDTNATPDYKHAFSVPAGTNIRIGTASGASFWSSSNNAVNAACSTSIVSACTIDKMAGGSGFVLVTSCTAGAVTYQWAQNTSSACATILKGGSWLAYKKL